MRIEDYFQQIRDTIDAAQITESSTVTYDKRATHQGFIRGEVYFVDGSILHVREFVDVETSVERLLYVYQYVDAASDLVFRYDNAEHHRHLKLPSFPHHKHDGSETSIVASRAPILAEVLSEIEPLVQLP